MPNMSGLFLLQRVTIKKVFFSLLHYQVKGNNERLIFANHN